MNIAPAMSSAASRAVTHAVSVVIPARDEAENLVGLIPEIAATLAGSTFEIVIVDDGSTDDTVSVVESLAGQGVPVRRVAHPHSLGQSAALMSGVRAATGELVVTLDGDGQNDPKVLPQVIGRFADPAIGLVAGQRVGRKGSAAKRIGSKIANGIRGAVLKDGTRDSACGIKGFRRAPFLDLPYFDSMHRFLPALFLGDGWRIAHIDVVDRPREHGRSHYGIWDRLAVGVSDLFGVWWLVRRRRRSPFRVEHK